MIKKIIVLLNLVFIFSCNSKELPRHCICESKINYSFKDNDYKYNNWDRRNSSFNIGFYFSYDSAYFYLKSSLKRKDTVYFINERGIKGHSKVINKVLLNDTIIILDTLYLPIKVKFSGYGWIYEGTIISPDQSEILFLYNDYSQPATLFILYDTQKWKKIYEITFPSIWNTNNFAWAPDGKKVLLYNLEKGDILLFDLENKSFKPITKEKEYSIRELKWGNSNNHFYYILNNKYLMKYDLISKRKSILLRIRNSLWAMRSINNFFILDNNDIFIEWTEQFKFLPYMLGIKHHDCLLKNCNNNL